MVFRFLAVFSLVFLACAGVGAQNFTASDDGRSIAVADRGQPVLTYVYDSPPAAEGAPAGPSNYIHPLYGLYGEIVTGDSPSNWSGAPGIHWGWSKIGCDAGVANLEMGEGGRRIFERILSVREANEGVEIVVQNVWVVGPDDHAQVIETVAVMVGPVVDGRRNIDFQVLLRSVSSGTIYLEGSVPGAGLGFVLNPERRDWGFASAAAGLDPNPKPYLSPWIVCSYRDDRRSSRSGVAMLQDNRNPGFSYPSWLIESTQRVLGGVPPEVKSALKPGEFLQFRYRLILHHLSGSRMEMTEAYRKFMADGHQTK